MDFFTIAGFLFVLYVLFYSVALYFVDCDLGLAFVYYFGKDLGKLRGKVIWITGASNGIGEAMAHCAATHGAKLVLSSRKKDDLDGVKLKCLQLNKSLTDEDVLVLPLDVTEVGTHQSCFDRVVEHFGTLDILMNNAGRSQRAVWENIELEVDRQIFELNVLGVVSLSRIAVRYFNKKGKGQIAVTSSVAGIMGVPYSASYTATKHAIHGYFNSLRMEKLGEKIKITLLCPGPTFSGYLQECFTETSDKDRRMTAARCAELSLVAIANKLDEAWMAIFPILPLVYGLQYFPNISRKIMGYMGSKQIQTLRDSRETVVTPLRKKQ